MSTTTFISSFSSFPCLSSFSPFSSSSGRQRLYSTKTLPERKLNHEIKRPPIVVDDKGRGRGCFLMHSGGNHQSVNSCFPLSSALFIFISLFQSFLFIFISLFLLFPCVNDNYSCLIFPPPAGRKPIGIIMYVGGAYFGAIPEVTYRYTMELLAKEGFFVVAVPYTVTFDHERAAREVYERFHLCMDSLSASGAYGISPSHLSSIPLYSVGHSNGALYQMLIGSYFAEKIPKANVVISFNNRPASQAVPLIDQLGPMISKIMPIVEASPVCSIVQYFSGIACEWPLKITSTIIQDYDQGCVALLTKIFAQLHSVMKEVIQGTSDFKPTPAENTECIKKSYNVPHTLLVKFSNDFIDQSDDLEKILKPRAKSIGGNQDKVILSGDHLTPCMQDVKWTVGYTPFFTKLARELKWLPLNETELFVKTIADWLKDIDHK